MKILSFILMLCSTIVLGQNVEGYEQMLEGMYKNTVKLSKAVELNYLINSNADITILDARETNECEVSGIKNATCVGYDNFDISTVENIDKNKPVYVYCSIGYRSERIGEKLQEAGFTKVFNLYGGIFDWANNGYPLYDADGNETNLVHGFDNDWSQWLNTNKCLKTIE